MNRSPMSYKQQSVPNRKMKAREDNMVDYLRNVAKKAQPGEPLTAGGATRHPVSDEAKTAIRQLAKKASQTGGKKQPRKQPKGRMPEPKRPANVPPAEEMIDQAFDEEGSFVMPPIEGYWLHVLEEKNLQDPNKQGSDWKDEAIAVFRRARQELEEMKKEYQLRYGE